MSLSQRSIDNSKLRMRTADYEQYFCVDRWYPSAKVADNGSKSGYQEKRECDL